MRRGPHQGVITREDVDSLILAVNIVRGALTDQPARPQDATLVRDLLKILPASTPGLKLIRQHCAEYLRDPCGSLWVLRELVAGTPKMDVVLGFMQPSKAVNAVFEVLMFQPVEVRESLLQEFPSNAAPIRVQACSDGLHNPHMLGIFPERLGIAGCSDNLQHDAPAWYLVDRFAERFRAFTQPAIEIAFASGELSNLRSVCDHRDWLLNAAAEWLARHEHFHRTGLLPFQQNQFAKGSLVSAGFEELRVDLLSVQSCFDSPDEDNNDSAIAEYVFADRLLSYPLVDLSLQATRPSFDTIGSQYLLASLLQTGCVTIHGSQLCLECSLKDAVELVAQQMCEVETLAMNQATGILDRDDKQKMIRAVICAQVERVTEVGLQRLGATYLRGRPHILGYYGRLHSSIRWNSD